MITDEIKSKQSRNATSALGLRMAGLLMLSFFAAPGNAEDATATTTDAQAYQLIQLLNRNEALISDVARLRGQVEELRQGAERSRESQKTIAADFDVRLGNLETKPVSGTSEDKAKINALELRMLQLEEAITAMHQVISSKALTPLETSPADDAYEAAQEKYRGGDYEAAVREFQAFLQSYGNDDAAPTARYWLAEALLQQNDYQTAIETGEALISTHPQNNKVPDTIFLLGKAHLGLGDAVAARDALETLVANYAGSDAAAKARDLLDRLP